MARYKYPYSDFHELNLDYILKLCRESLGIGLKVVGRELYLVNDLEEPISKVTISFADTALTDVDGKPIKSYLISAGVDNKKLVFTNGDHEITSITVPYATKAEEDIHGEKIDSYVRNVDVAGDKIRITFGDGHTYVFTVPYAVKASEDVNHKLITTYAAGIRVDGNEIVLTDGTDTEIKRITVHYAETASADDEGAEIKKTYAHSLTTGQTTVKLIAKDGTQLSEITVPYAVSALKDVEGQDFLSAYAQHLIVDGQRIAVEAHDGTRLSTITVPFATLATDATNAIESIRIVGDQLVATTYGGVNTELTIPYALRAKNDHMGNEITKSYVASVTNNPTTGEISFFDKEGNIIALLVPSVKTAENDTYGNLIADFVKTVTVTDDSNYVTVTHGNGLADTLLINYSTHALKDANENLIHNTYVAFLAMVHDDQDEPWLVAYNGERSEIFRLQIEANRAKHADEADFAERALKDSEGNVIIDTYGVELAFEDERLTLINAAGESLGHVTIKQNFGEALNVTDDKKLQLLNGEGSVLSEVELPSGGGDGTSLDYNFNLSGNPSYDGQFGYNPETKNYEVNIDHSHYTVFFDKNCKTPTLYKRSPLVINGYINPIDWIRPSENPVPAGSKLKFMVKRFDLGPEIGTIHVDGRSIDCPLLANLAYTLYRHDNSSRLKIGSTQMWSQFEYEDWTLSTIDVSWFPDYSSGAHYGANRDSGFLIDNYGDQPLDLTYESINAAYIFDIGDIAIDATFPIIFIPCQSWYGERLIKCNAAMGDYTQANYQWYYTTDHTVHSGSEWIAIEGATESTYYPPDEDPRRWYTCVASSPTNPNAKVFCGYAVSNWKYNWE